MSAYRDDHDALLAQCDALRGELSKAQKGSDELTRIQAELELKLKELGDARISEAEKGIAAKRMTMRGLRLGFLVSALLASAVFAYFSFRGGDKMSESGNALDTPAGWFAEARAHCNPVEASLYLKDRTPPKGDEGLPYKAACFALAGKLGEAHKIMGSLSSAARPPAAHLIFNVVHPIADAGDDMAAGPVMEFVLVYTPNNYMALYHAGMSAFGKGDTKRAKRRLREFLALYSDDNFFTQTAIKSLAELDAQKQE